MYSLANQESERTVSSTQITTTSPSSTALAGAFGFDSSILAGQCSPSTIKMYKRDFEAYRKWAATAGEPAGQAATLAKWRATLAESSALSPNTINRMLSAVKRIMQEAAAQGYCPSELAAQFEQVAGVKVQALRERQKSHARTLISPEQMRLICTAPNANTLPGKMHRALLATLAGSGCRISEIVSLKPAQIEYGPDDTGKLGYTLKVMGKNQREPREAPLSTEAHHLIGQWLAARSAAGISSEYIFTGFGGRGGRQPRTTPITPASAWEMVQRYAKACQLAHIKPHDFRRFVGTRLAKQDIRKAQKALGHKRIETTAQHYVLDSLERGLTDNLY